VGKTSGKSKENRVNHEEIMEGENEHQANA